MYTTAKSALERLEESNYEELRTEYKRNGAFVHGDYNYHNILMSYSEFATTNFEHARNDIQVTDLYYFLRKVMEKNHWDISLGEKILNCYQKYIPFQKGELEYIAICLAYPEKFWKAANSYYRSRKVWLPAKNLEKLELVIKQDEEKKTFLEKIFAFHL
jgi:spore coat protein I